MARDPEGTPLPGGGPAPAVRDDGGRGAGAPRIEGALSQRRYTILLVPEDSRGLPRRIEVTDRLLRRVALGSGAVLALLTALGAGLILLVMRGGDQAAMRLRAENVALRLRLQSLERQVDQAALALDRIRVQDARIRQLTLADQAVRPYGIGPLSEVDMDAVDAARAPAPPPEPDATERGRPLEERLAALLSRAAEQELSLEEVAAYLDDRHSILRGYPTIWPVQGWLTSGFGRRRPPMLGASSWHQGVDISADFGAEVVATADGIVTWAGWSDGYGNLVVVDHGFGFVTRYAHNSELLVSPGDRVRRGQPIARVGSTGRSTGPHVHYEVHRHGVPVNPDRFLARDDGGGAVALVD